jgi:threonine dehydrogenase-like Zn-dependent dehydrogenase
VQALVSGISRGTEALVYRGQVPPSLWPVMRCPFQAGEFPGPVKYGYSLVGRVESGPAAGQGVFVLHPHQDRLQVPATACRPLPDGLPTERAVLAANMETAINILWDAGALPGQRISVIGAGVVGALVAALAGQLPGAEVTLIDRLPDRRRLADRLGVGFALPEQATGNQDLVIHASGHPDGLALALTLAGQEATIVEASWYGDQTVSLPLGEAFHSRRLRLLSSQVGQIAPAQRPRWSHSDRLDLALRLLADPDLGPRLDCLLDGESRFADLPATMARLVSQPVLCHVIRY